METTFGIIMSLMGDLPQKNFEILVLKGVILGHFVDKFARCQIEFLKRLKVARCQIFFARCQANLPSAKFGTWHPFSQH